MSPDDLPEDATGPGPGPADPAAPPPTALGGSQPVYVVGVADIASSGAVPFPDATAAPGPSPAWCWVVAPYHPGGARPADQALDGSPGPVLTTSTKAELVREVSQ